MTSSNKREIFDKEFSPITGHDKIKEILFNFYSNDSIPNSIIFYGNQGIGKFKTADIFSRLLCKKPVLNKGSDLFGFEEEQPLEVNQNIIFEDIKIIEPNASNNISVEKIREIRDFLSLTSSNSPYKIIIINKAECLNIQASNAMLKILEEPNKNTIFILISNNINRIYDTIKSRCIKVKFNNLSFEEYKNILKQFDIKADIDLYKKTSGSVSKTREILENNVKENVDRFTTILKNKNSSLSQLSKISDKIKENKEKYDVFNEYLINEIISENKDNREVLEIIKTLNGKNTDISDNLKSIRYKYI